MLSRLLLLGLLVLAGWTGVDAREPVAPMTQVRIGKILWYNNYDQAMALARQQQKPVWVHFGENPG